MTAPLAQQQLIGTDGRRITRRAIQRGLRINIVAGAFGMMWAAAAMGMTTTLFMEALGASGVMIGMIVTIQQVAMFMQIPAAYFAERLSTRKRFWAWCVIPQRILWIVPALLPYVIRRDPSLVAWSMLGVVAVSSILTFTGSASWHSWMADFIPEQIRGRFWGLRQSVTMVAYLLGIGISGWILDRFANSGTPAPSFLGFSIVFVLAALVGTADIIVHLWVPEPRPTHSNAAVGLLPRLLAPLKQRDFLWTTLAFGAWAFAVGLVGSFSIIYLKRTFSASYSHIALITISASVGAAISGLLWGRIMDAVGGRALGGVMLSVAPLFGAVWFFVRNVGVDLNLPAMGAVTVPQPILLLAVVNLFAGAFYHGVVLSQFSMTAALAPREGRTMAMAVHWTLVGAIAATGPLLGGRIMDFFEARSISLTFPTGTQFSFIHSLVLVQVVVIWAVALPLLMRVRKGTGDASVRLLISNPLRTVGTLQNMLTVGTAITSRQRAEVVRRIGASRSALALTELIRRLDDPAAEVREEAALALGQIGTSEAITALIDRLNDPESDLGPQIARGLRTSKDPEAVDTLVRQLQQNDRETQAECARALGEIGDPRATEALLALLRKSDDSKLVTASSEALAQLGSIAAIHDILPRMKTTRNPVLKRSLAVAVGDLLAGRQSFYKCLIEEEETPSAYVVRGLERLRRSVRSNMVRNDIEAYRQMVDNVNRLEEAYEEENYAEAAALARSLAGLLAELHSGNPRDGHAYNRHLNDCLAAGTWYLDYLCTQWPEHYGRPDRQDVLLGIHFLITHFAGKPTTGGRRDRL